jgi:hypothetical protein
MVGSKLQFDSFRPNGMGKTVDTCIVDQNIQMVFSFPEPFDKLRNGPG